MNAILRPAEARGHANHGWLDTFHSFSFAHYFDPAHMGFRSLRVINDDIVKPGTGFATHGHRDMEIVTYVIDGELAHKDSTGQAQTIRKGDVQVMSAGTGIRHSEFNPSRTNDVRLLQIWIVPQAEGLPPAYAQHSFDPADKANRLALLAGPAARGAPLTIQQDALVHASQLQAGQRLAYGLARGRGAWVQVATGGLTVNGQRMKEGDGLALEEIETIDIQADSNTEFLLFDLA
jgi:redox-sensitive bicupin YhaK (pirin superfamily)